MGYKKKYRDLVEAVKELQKANPHDEGIQKWIEANIPELKESEDERIREELKFHFKQLKQQNFVAFTKDGPDVDAILAWLEK